MESKTTPNEKLTAQMAGGPVINGVQGCGPACNVNHEEAKCFMCGNRYDYYQTPSSITNYAYRICELGEAGNLNAGN